MHRWREGEELWGGVPVLWEGCGGYLTVETYMVVLPGCPVLVRRSRKQGTLVAAACTPAVKWTTVHNGDALVGRILYA